MSKLDAMADVRGGVIYAAARVNPVTARTWTKTVALTLGTPRAGGHPRYDIADVISLLMMRNLTWDLGVTAATAARLVNRIRPHLLPLADAAVAEQERTGKYRWEGYPMAAARLVNLAEQDLLYIVKSDAQLLAAVAEGRPTCMVVQLQGLISKAIYEMERVMFGEVAEWSDKAA